MSAATQITEQQLYVAPPGVCTCGRILRAINQTPSTRRSPSFNSTESSKVKISRFCAARIWWGSDFFPRLPTTARLPPLRPPLPPSGRAGFRRAPKGRIGCGHSDWTLKTRPIPSPSTKKRKSSPYELWVPRPRFSQIRDSENRSTPQYPTTPTSPGHSDARIPVRPRDCASHHRNAYAHFRNTERPPAPCRYITVG